MQVGRRDLSDALVRGPHDERGALARVGRRCDDQGEEAGVVGGHQRDPARASGHQLEVTLVVGRGGAQGGEHELEGRRVVRRCVEGEQPLA